MSDIFTKVTVIRQREWFRLQWARFWLPLILLWIVARLPLGGARALGAVFGRLMYLANPKRRRITRINIDLCFPELAPKQREKIVRRHFVLAGQAYFDIPFLVWASERRFRAKTRIVGLENVQAAMHRGRRIILLAPHCIGMNVGGIVVARHLPVFSMIKLQRSPFVNWLLNRARGRYDSPLLVREQGLRPVLRGLQSGMAFYYLPDEDFGPQQSVFAPFFGVSTATLATLGRLAEHAGADVIPCFTRLLPGGQGYEVVLHDALADFPTGDRVADATRMNQAFEHGIRPMAEQYMWTFKLFKTRPDGGPSPYV